MNQLKRASLVLQKYSENSMMLEGLWGFIVFQSLRKLKTSKEQFKVSQIKIHYLNEKESTVNPC